MLISKKARLAYPIVDGIPLLLKSEAIKISLEYERKILDKLEKVEA
jgi:uncharacterized protein YbaR (Trm112 family)